MQPRKQQGAPLCERAAGEFWAAEMSRRQFLRAGLTLVAVGLAAPPWLAHIAHADAQRLRKGEQLPNDHILVVRQRRAEHDCPVSRRVVLPRAPDAGNPRIAGHPAG